MKFLVIGCNGMAGHMISLYLHEQGHDVIGFARTQSKFVRTVCGDVLDTVAIKKAVKGEIKGSKKDDSIRRQEP